MNNKDTENTVGARSVKCKGRKFNPLLDLFDEAGFVLAFVITLVVVVPAAIELSIGFFKLLCTWLSLA